MAFAKRRWWARRPATPLSEPCEAMVLGITLNRVLITARWTGRGGTVHTNTLVVSRAYWMRRYGNTPEEAMA